MNQAVGDHIRIDNLGGRNGQFVLLQVTSSGNILGSFYWQLNMGLYYIIFGENLKHLLLIRFKIHYDLY